MVIITVADAQSFRNRRAGLGRNARFADSLHFLDANCEISVSVGRGNPQALGPHAISALDAENLFRVVIGKSHPIIRGG